MSNDTQLAHDMLQHIADPNVRQQYGNILNGQVVGIVHCHSQLCKGRAIAQLMADDTVQELPPVEVTEAQAKKFIKAKQPIPRYVSGLEGDRVRLDGSRGFRCYCGNASILHEHEQGIITANQPTKRDIEAVFGKMSRNPSKYNEIDGTLYVDGFSIERVA